jgi:hypothetical protein
MLMLSIASLWVSFPSPVEEEYWQQLTRKDAIAWNLIFVLLTLHVWMWIQFMLPARSRILCPICEYNLAGNTSGVCPECGTPVPPDIARRLSGAPADGLTPVVANG